MKKRIFSTTLFFIVCSTMFSQPKEGFYAEFWGASTTIGIHYDTRFNENTKWGGRFGIAYTNSSSTIFFQSCPNKTTGITFPIAVNYLIGNDQHNLELGIGISYGLYSCNYIEKSHEVQKDKNAFFGFVDLGYRFLSKKGLIIRAGINPGMSLSTYDDLGREEHGVDREAVIYPYIGIGYMF